MLRSTQTMGLHVHMCMQCMVSPIFLQFVFGLRQ